MKELLIAVCFMFVSVSTFAAEPENWVAHGVRVVTQDNIQGSTSFDFKHDGFANKKDCDDYIAAQNELELVNSWDGVSMGQRVSALCLQSK